MVRCPVFRQCWAELGLGSPSLIPVGLDLLSQSLPVSRQERSALVVETWPSKRSDREDGAEAGLGPAGNGAELFLCPPRCCQQQAPRQQHLHHRQEERGGPGHALPVSEAHQWHLGVGGAPHPAQQPQLHGTAQPLLPPTQCSPVSLGVPSVGLQQSREAATPAMLLKEATRSCLPGLPPNDPRCWGFVPFPTSSQPFSLGWLG